LPENPKHLKVASHNGTPLKKIFVKEEFPPLTSENWLQRTRTFLNKDTGLYELIDILTGKLIACQNKCEGPWDLSTMNEVNIDGRVILIPHGADHSKISTRKQHHYSQNIVDLICNEIAGGKAMTKVLEQTQYPSAPIFAVWRKEHPEINDQLDYAYEMRGEFARDKIQEIVDTEATDKMQLDNQKINLDANKWLAGKDAPKRFGDKKADVEVGRDMVINIISNIDRTPKEREIIDVTKKQISDGIKKDLLNGGDS